MTNTQKINLLNSRKYMSKISLKITLALMLMFSLVNVVFGQGAPSQNNNVMVSSSVSSSTPTAATKGVNPTIGSYGGSNFDKINLFNGNVSMSFPLASLTSRGGMSVGIVLSYNSKIWRVERYDEERSSKIFAEPPTVAKTYHPVYDEYDPGNPQLGAGWTIHAGRLTARQSVPDKQLSTSCFFDDPTGHRPVAKPAKTLTTIVFTAPDGTEYDLRDTIYDGEYKGLINCEGVSRGNTFVSKDGTSATFVCDTNITDALGNDTITNLNGYLYLRDGTRFRIQDGRPVQQRDHNGNIVKYEYTGNQLTKVTDNMGRTITVVYGFYNHTLATITIKGFGAADRVTTVRGDKLDQHLASGQAHLTIDQLFPVEAVQTENYQFAFNPKVVSAVILPDGHQWAFEYNSYGEVIRVITPARGKVEYDMGPSTQAGGGAGGYNETFNEIFRRVLERRTYPDPTQVKVEGTVTYTDPTDVTKQDADGNVTVTEKELDANDLSTGQAKVITESRHKFSGNPNKGMSGRGYRDWREGKEIETRIINPATNSPMRTVVNQYQLRAGVSWAKDLNGNPVDKDYLFQPENDPRVIKVTTSLLDGTPKTSIVDYAYDGFNNVTSEQLTGYNGEIIRKVDRSYVTSLNGFDYTGLNRNLAPANDPNFYDIHMRSLIASETISNGAQIVESKTTYDYDNYSSDSLHAPLVGRSLTVNSHATNYQDPNRILRGNVTSVNRGVDTSAITTTYPQYDVLGNVVAVVGPLTNQKTTTNYSADSQFTFPTSTTWFVNGGLSGTRTLTSSKTYDFSTGLVTSSTGMNNEVTTFQYNDLLDRLTLVTRPLGKTPGGAGQTSYAYSAPGDYPNVVTVVSSLDNSQDLTSISKFDGFLRTTEQHRTDPGGEVVSQTFYDATGRVFKVTNPFRPGQDNDTDGYTTSKYDPLDRVWMIETFDKNGISTGVVTTDYNTNLVTVTDQAGKKRKSETDAAGRLMKVYEPSSPANVLDQITSYIYDARSNLMQVNQGAQIRTFAYDSLSRLTSATSPEGGTTTYTYDKASNLLTRRDARQVTTTYTYDSLNRLATKTYSDITPPVSYFYDVLPSDLPTGVTPPQPYQSGLLKGRLVATATPNMAANSVMPSLSATATFYGYDSIGRVTDSYQLVDGQYFHSANDYNFASLPTSLQYPSGRNLVSTYNLAGQLDSEVFDNGLIANQMQYTPSGAVSRQVLGNALYHHVSYNSRLQPTTISLGTTDSGQNASDKLKIEYDYGFYSVGDLNAATAPLPNGTQLDHQDMNNGNIGRIRVTHGAFSTGGGGGGGSNLANPGNGSKSNTVIKGGKPLYNLIYNPTMEQGFAYDELNRLVLAKEFTAPGVNGPTCPQLNAGTLFVEPGTTSTVVLTGSDLNSVQQVNITPSTGLTVSIIGVSADKLTLNIVTDASAGGMQYGLSVVGSCGEISASGISVSCYATNNLVTNMDVTGVDAVGGLSFELDNGPKDGVSTLNKQTVTGTGSIDIDLTAEHFDPTKLALPVLRIQYSANTQIMPSTSVTASYQCFINGVAVEGHIPGTGTSVPASDTLGITVDASGNVTGNGVGPDRNSRFQDIEVSLTGAIGSKITFSYQATITTTSSNGVFPAVVTGINGSGGCTLLTVAQPLAQVTEPSPLAQGASWYQAYTYDRYGNRTKVEGDNSQTLVFDPTNNNRITQVMGNPNLFTYDAAGNVKTDQQGNTYFYDAENRMIKAQSSSGFHLFQYDGDGHRVKKKDLGQSGGRLYIHAGAGTLIAEYLTIADGQVQLDTTDKEYIYGASGLVATRVFNGSIEFITPDHLGSPRVYTDAGGSIISRHDYFPFGEEITGSFNGRNAMGGFGGDDKLTHKFTGYERDDETGLDFAQARYFSAMMGRFTSVDPLGRSAHLDSPQTWNRYDYTLNNPINLTDPLGLDPVERPRTKSNDQAAANVYNWGLPKPLEILKGIVKEAVNSLAQAVMFPIFANGEAEMAGLQPLPKLESKNRDQELGGVLFGIGSLLVPEIPHGFKSEEAFAEFSGTLKTGLKSVANDAIAMFQGSSVTGKSYKTGAAFDVGRVSDYDIAVGSRQLFAKAQKEGIIIREGKRTGPLTEAELHKLGLDSLRKELSEKAGRPVNFMIYDFYKDARSRSKSIMVK